MFLIADDATPINYSMQSTVDTSCRTTEDWDPSETEEDERIIRLAHSISGLAVELHPEVSAITLEEGWEAQESDEECRLLRENIQMRRETHLIEDECGIIVCVAVADGILQVFVPRKLRQRLLHLAHHTLLAGNPSIARQFYTMRKQWYWLSMITDIRATSKRSQACAKERLTIR